MHAVSAFDELTVEHLLRGEAPFGSGLDDVAVWIGNSCEALGLPTDGPLTPAHVAVLEAAMTVTGLGPTPQVSWKQRRRNLRRRITASTVLSGFIAKFLGLSMAMAAAGSGAAAVGALPTPVQWMASDIGSVVGVDLPNPHEEHIDFMGGIAGPSTPVATMRPIDVSRVVAPATTAADITTPARDDGVPAAPADDGADIVGPELVPSPDADIPPTPADAVEKTENKVERIQEKADEKVERTQDKVEEGKGNADSAEEKVEKTQEKSEEKVEKTQEKADEKAEKAEARAERSEGGDRSDQNQGAKGDNGKATGEDDTATVESEDDD